MQQWAPSCAELLAEIGHQRVEIDIFQWHGHGVIAIRTAASTALAGENPVGRPVADPGKALSEIYSVIKKKPTDPDLQSSTLNTYLTVRKQVGSFEKAAAMSGCWGSPISDDALHALVQRSAARYREIGLPPPPPPKTQQPPYSLVVMLDGWMARERGEAWGLPPAPSPQERVAWREVKSAVVYRVEDRVEKASGRGLLIEKKVVAVAPGTDVVDFGAMVQEQAMRCGLAAAREVFVVADGALCGEPWKKIRDRHGDAVRDLCTHDVDRQPRRFCFHCQIGTRRSPTIVA